MCLLGCFQISPPLQALARLDQVLGQTRPSEVDVESLQQADALQNCPAGLPEGASFTRTDLDSTLSGESERAVLGFDLAHVSSVRPRRSERHPAQP